MSEFLLRFNLIRAAQAVGSLMPEVMLNKKGRKTGVWSIAIFFFFLFGGMREILRLILYLVNQKVSKTIESTLTWGGTKPSFSKYLTVWKIDILALRTTNTIPFKNKSCGGTAFGNVLCLQVLIVLKIFLTLKQVMTILGVWLPWKLLFHKNPQ